VVWPGQPNCYYHAEEGQEDFLVVSGECLVLIEGQERRLRAWDFVHCPPFTEHVFVGAGDGPCVFVGVGARNGGEGLVYPVSELALGHQAGVSEEGFIQHWLVLAPIGMAVIFAGRVPTIIGVTLLAIFGFKEFARASGLYRDWWMTGAAYAGIVTVGASSLMSHPRGEEPGTGEVQWVQPILG
jgi:hypothetical protein